MAVIFDIAPSPDSVDNWGSALGTLESRASQTWVADVNATLTSVEVKMYKLNSPTDNVTLTVYSGGSNPENGTSLGTVVIDGSTFPSSAGTYTTFTFSTPITITSGTTYWFTFTRATLDSVNRYRWEHLTTGSGGWEYLADSGGWFAEAAIIANSIRSNGSLSILARPIFYK